ncbi:MAG TPA: hypothetical protein VGJ00_05715 [Rhabdochlamydiaceae bacterium]|jgi:hypothetical protein
MALTTSYFSLPTPTTSDSSQAPCFPAKEKVTTKGKVAAVVGTLFVVGALVITAVTVGVLFSTNTFILPGTYNFTVYFWPAFLGIVGLLGTYLAYKGVQSKEVVEIYKIKTEELPLSEDQEPNPTIERNLDEVFYDLESRKSLTGPQTAIPSDFSYIETRKMEHKNGKFFEVEVFSNRY